MRRSPAVGFTLVLLSAFFFAVSGPIAKALYGIGWTPGSVVLIRLAGSAALLLPVVLVSLRGNWGEVRRHWKTIVVYGVVSMTGVQAFFFIAVDHLSVAVAILLEIMGAPIIIVLWVWARTRRRPAVLTMLGITVSLIGVVCVLDFHDAVFSWIGIAAAIGAAACFAGYFFLSANEKLTLTPIALTGLGMIVGAGAAVALTATPLLPARFVTGDVSVAGLTTPWWVPVILLIACTAVAYVCGVVGLRHLGPTIGSFTNLTEIPFAAIAAWIILAEALSPVQIIGGAVIIAGIVLVKWGDVRVERRVSRGKVVHLSSTQVDLEIDQDAGQAGRHDPHTHSPVPRIDP